MRKTLMTLMCGALFACGGGGGGGDPEDSGRTLDGGSDALVADANTEPDGLFTGPEIAVSPVMLTLAAEAGQTSAPVPLLIQNQGSAPLTISSLGLDPPVDEIANDAPSFPAVIAPGESLTVNFTYTPADDEEVNTQVVIRSDDGDEGFLTIGVLARTAERCLVASPMEVNLGSVNPGTRTGQFGLQLRTCGDLPVNLTTVTLDGPEQFEWEALGGRVLDGGMIEPGSPLRMQFAYVNSEGLPAGEQAVATLVVESDAVNAPRLEVPVRVTGGDGPSCIVLLEPNRLEFDAVRVGLTATLPATVTNSGTAECELAAVRVEKTRGPEENTFAIARGIEQMVLAGGESYEIEISFSPVTPNPVGDQGTLFVEYRDPHIMQNRRAQAFVTGVGAEALIGSDPMGGIDFGQATAPGCAGPDLTVRAANVGFVPLDVISYRLDGNCEHFHLLDEPDLSTPVPLEESEFVEWAFRYQPNEVSNHRCDILVTSDAMNFDVLRIPMEGEGTEDASRRDRIIVGRLDANRPARFPLSHAPVPESITVSLDGEQTEDWDYDEEFNQVVFSQRNHPERGAEMIILYDGFCFERAE